MINQIQRPSGQITNESAESNTVILGGGYGSIKKTVNYEFHNNLPSKSNLYILETSA